MSSTAFERARETAGVGGPDREKAVMGGWFPEDECGATNERELRSSRYSERCTALGVKAGKGFRSGGFVLQRAQSIPWSIVEIPVVTPTRRAVMAEETGPVSPARWQRTGGREGCVSVAQGARGEAWGLRGAFVSLAPSTSRAAQATRIQQPTSSALIVYAFPLASCRGAERGSASGGDGPLGDRMLVGAWRRSFTSGCLPPVLAASKASGRPSGISMGITKAGDCAQA